MNSHTRHLLTGWIVAVIGVHFAQAYDAHHPNPMLILNGTFHRKHTRKPTLDKQERNATRLQSWRMYHRRKESKYLLKPEPYSIADGKNDPELLGPQRTYVATASTVVGSNNASVAQAASTPQVQVPILSSETNASALASTLERSTEGNKTASTLSRSIMARDECIELIGQATFDRYVKKFGTEKGALRRCLIFKRHQ